MYKVTLAMPVYNVEKFVSRAIFSALNQTFESIEFLIIDDVGNDDSINIIRQIVLSHPRGKDVRIIDHVVNQGTGATKNSAITEATGKYIYFMDSDDLISPDCIEILYKKMFEKPVDFIASSHVNIDQYDKKSNGCQYENIQFNSNAKLIKYKYVDKLPFTTATWNKLYSLEFLKINEIRCIPHHLCEDQIFTYQILLSAKTASLISDITYCYYENVGSTMDKINKRNFSEKTCIEYLEIIAFKAKYLQKFSSTYPFLSVSLMTEIFYTAAIIFQSTAISKKTKRSYISDLFKYRFNYRDVLTLNKRGIIIVILLITFKLPYCIQTLILNLTSSRILNN